MKKNLQIIAVMAIAMTAMLSSCSKNDGDKSQLEKEYFTIENATYKSGKMPAATTDQGFSNVSTTENVLNGGSSFLTVTSPVALSTFYVAVDGIGGHYEFDAQQMTNDTRAEDGYVYQFAILISQNLGGEFTIKVTAQNENGDVMPEFTHEFGQILAGTGALQVNLSFSNAKDIDLYLVTPDDQVIYYGDRGLYGDWNEETGSYMVWGLDVDSNAGCGIDNINSENIFFPEEYVMNGKYEVYVNMFSNCDPSVATSWVATAIYNNRQINPTSGNNPANGVYPIDTESTYGGDPRYDTEDFVKAMEFTISGAAVNPQTNSVSQQRVPKYGK